MEDIIIPEDMEYSNQYAQGFYNEHFSNIVKQNGTLYSDGTLPEDYVDVNGHVFHKNKKGAWVETDGSARYNYKTKKTDVYLYKMAYISKEQLYLTMGHEYLHSAINSLGPSAVGKHDLHHIGIYKWEYAQAQAWNYKVDDYQKRYNLVKDLKGFNYSKLGFYVIDVPIF